VLLLEGLTFAGVALVLRVQLCELRAGVEVGKVRSADLAAGRLDDVDGVDRADLVDQAAEGLGDGAGLAGVRGGLRDGGRGGRAEGGAERCSGHDNLHFSHPKG
jgi:hypothetical protein